MLRIHAVAVDVAVVDQDVAEVDADTEADPLVLLDLGLPLGQPLLDLHGADHRVGDARKLDQGTVAHQFDDPPVVRFDHRLEEALSQRLEARVSTRLILRHEPAVAYYIGRKNRRKLTLGTLLHRIGPAEAGSYLFGQQRSPMHSGRVQDHGRYDVGAIRVDRLCCRLATRPVSRSSTRSRTSS